MARIAESRKKRSFKKFTFRGIDLDKLLDLKPEDLLPLVRDLADLLLGAARGLLVGLGVWIGRLTRTCTHSPPLLHPRQFTSRVRRRLSRPLKRKHKALVKKLKKAKKEAGPLEKPAIIKTHLRDLVITPELIGSIVAIYNGKVRPHLTRAPA